MSPLRPPVPVIMCKAAMDQMHDMSTEQTCDHGGRNKKKKPLRGIDAGWWLPTIVHCLETSVKRNERDKQKEKKTTLIYKRRLRCWSHTLIRSFNGWKLLQNFNGADQSCPKKFKRVGVWRWDGVEQTLKWWSALSLCYTFHVSVCSWVFCACCFIWSPRSGEVTDDLLNSLKPCSFCSGGIEIEGRADKTQQRFRWERSLFFVFFSFCMFGVQFGFF